MARRRPAVRPDGELVAALDEAETIEALAGYRFRVTDPPLADGGLNTEELREICQSHPDHPAVVAIGGNLDAADEIRRKAALHG